MPEPGRLRGRPLPEWARWNTIAAASPWTIGLEEELVLIDPRTGGVANRIEDVLYAAAYPLREHLSAETHACVVELMTDAHDTVAGVVSDLALVRRELEDIVREELDLLVIASGTHPLGKSADVDVSTATSRYRKVGASLRGLARREPTMALHVHVAVPDEQMATRALDGLLADLPVLLALSANSPFWHGDDSGLASSRALLLSMFPRSGLPRRFGAYSQWVATIDTLLTSGAIPDPGFVWWDVRLRPTLGTVEVRILDSQARLKDVAALAALVQCLVRLHATSAAGPSAPAELLAENRFLAARAGSEAQLLDPRTLVFRPLRAALAEILADCAPLASELGCASELADVSLLSLDGGYSHQRRLAALHGIEELPSVLAREFAAGDFAPDMHAA